MVAYSIDAVVAGVGVVGLAVGRRLALAGLEVLLAEKCGHIGAETSSRNSEVIHAGLYYPTGSWKAKTCVAGNALLYRFCAERDVRARKCGKLVIASSPSQAPRMQALWDQAHVNGRHDLSWLTPSDVQALEPEVRCVAGLFSPSTGIVDSHGYMLALQQDMESHGGVLALNAPVSSANVANGGLRIFTAGLESAEINARFFVNAAGHGAPKLAANIEGLPRDYAPRQWFAKGSYFALDGRQPFSHLVYPVPDATGFGVHAIFDMEGRCRFGPDVEWVENENDLAVSADRADSFYAAIRSFWPKLPDNALRPDFAGVRPRLHGPGDPAADFRIDGPEDHHVAGLVNLLGIDSPGLTASLAIADVVAEKLGLT
jgi:L-2-hydroxyglutarate oxidase LhgO